MVRMKRAIAVVGIVLAMSLAVIAADDEKYSEVKVTVLREASGKPVRNASVVVLRLNKEGKQERWGMQLKTDSEGNASLHDVPYGKVRVQVIARGLQTFGEDYEINSPEQELVIKLKPPQEQYSIYK